jgi:hypothetical protein
MRNGFFNRRRIDGLILPLDPAGYRVLVTEKTPVRTSLVGYENWNYERCHGE